MHFVIYHFVLFVHASESQLKEAMDEESRGNFFRLLFTALNSVGNSNDESFDAAETVVVELSQNKISRRKNTNKVETIADPETDTAKESKCINPENLQPESSLDMDLQDQIEKLLRDTCAFDQCQQVMTGQEVVEDISSRLKRRAADSDRNAKRACNMGSGDIQTASTSVKYGQNGSSISNTEVENDLFDEIESLDFEHMYDNADQSLCDNPAVHTDTKNQLLEDEAEEKLISAQVTTKQNKNNYFAFKISDMADKEYSTCPPADKSLYTKDLSLLQYRNRSKPKPNSDSTDVAMNEKIDSYATYKTRIVLFVTNNKKRDEPASALELTEFIINFNMLFFQDSKKTKVSRLYYAIARHKNVASATPTFYKRLYTFVRKEKIHASDLDLIILTTTYHVFPYDRAEQCFLPETGSSLRCILNDIYVKLQKLINDTFAAYLTSDKPYDFHQTILDNILFVKTCSGFPIFNENIKRMLCFMPELLVYLEHRKVHKVNNIALSGLAAEITSFKIVFLFYADLFKAYDAKSIAKLTNAVEMLRKVINHFFITNITDSYNRKNSELDAKLHMYEYAMKLRYMSPKISIEDEKIANALFILSFTSDHTYLYGSTGVAEATIEYSAVKNDILVLIRERSYVLTFQILIEYYNYIGIKLSRKLMVFPWKKLMLAFLVENEDVHVCLCPNRFNIAIMYDELQHGLSIQ